MKTRLMLVLALWVAPLWVSAQPLADRLPPDALMYMGWQGTDAPGGAYAGSRLKGVLDATNYAQLVNDFLPAAMQRMAKEDRQFARVMPVLSTIGTAVWKHPTAVYVGPFDVRAGAPPMPRIALLCDAAADAPAVLQQVNTLLAQVRPGAPVEIAAKTQGGLVVVTVGTMSPAFNQAVAGGDKGASLAGDKKFVAAFAQTQPEPALAMYLDFEAVLAQVEQAMAGNPDEQAKAQWAKSRDFLNLQGMKQLAAASGFDGKEWGTSLFFGAPAPRKGLLAMIDSPPLAADLLSTVPKTATWAAAGKFNLSGLFDGLREVAGQAPGGREQFDQGVQQISLAFGLDIQKDVLAAFGEDWVVYADPNSGGRGMLGLVVVNHLADASKAEATFGKVEQLVFQIIQANMRDAKVRINMQQTQVGGLTLHYLAVPLVSPTWAVTGGNLYLGLFPQTVSAGADFVASRGPSLQENEAFKATMARLAQKAGGAKFSSISFADLPRTAPESYAVWVGLSRGVGVADLFGIPSPAMLLPPLNKLMPQLAPAGAAAWRDDGGFHARSITPFPGADMIASDPLAGGAAATPVLVSILLPSLSKARETANRMKCAANLRMIGQGCLLYANGHKGNYPPDLGSLFTDVDLTPQVFICPSGDTTIPASATATKEATVAWINANADYVYLGAGKTMAAAAADIMVCHEKPENHHAGMNVLFGDGHVDFLPSAEVERQLERQQPRKP